MGKLFRAAFRAKAQDDASGGYFHAMPLLVALREAGALRANELADRVFSDPSTISRQVAGLVDRGYVDRQPDPDDGRASRLVLSAAGQELLDDRLAARERQLAQMLTGWSVADRHRLADLLSRFADDFSAHVSTQPFRPEPPREPS
jgi:DNA-binding MarR family transcriptional regulator